MQKNFYLKKFVAFSVWKRSYSPGKVIIGKSYQQEERSA